MAHRYVRNSFVALLTGRAEAVVCPTDGDGPHGESGRFEIHAPVPRDWPPAGFRQAEMSLSSVGWCKVKAFTDDSTGGSVNYRQPKPD